METHLRLLKALKQTKELIENGTLVFICHALKHSSHKLDQEFFENFLKLNKPTRSVYPEFYNHKSYIGSVVWWSTTKSGKEQRILFLDMLIERLSSYLLNGHQHVMKIKPEYVEPKVFWTPKYNGVLGTWFTDPLLKDRVIIIQP